MKRLVFNSSFDFDHNLHYPTVSFSLGPVHVFKKHKYFYRVIASIFQRSARKNISSVISFLGVNGIVETTNVLCLRWIRGFNYFMTRC